MHLDSLYSVYDDFFFFFLNIFLSLSAFLTAGVWFVFCLHSTMNTHFPKSAKPAWITLFHVFLDHRTKQR